MPLHVFSCGKNVTDPTLFTAVFLSLKKGRHTKKLHNGVGWDGEKWKYKDHIFIFFDLVLRDIFGVLGCARVCVCVRICVVWWWVHNVCMKVLW